MMNLSVFLPSLRLACLAVAVALPVATAPARADAQEPVDAANAQYRKASAAVERKDWPEVRQLLLPLWEKKRTWDVAVGLGKAEWYLGNRAVGTRYMAFAVANIPPKEKTRAVEGLRTALNEMKAGVGTLLISVNKDHAEVLADGHVVGSSPLETDTFLDPGPHVLQARLGNAVSAKETVEVEAGKTYNVALLVDPSIKAAPIAAPVATQDDKLNEPPPVQQTPPEASHSDSGSVQPRTIALIAGASVTAIAAGVGIVFALKASSHNQDAKNIGGSLGPEECSNPMGTSISQCSELETSLNSRDSASRVEAVSFGIAGVAAVTTAVLYFAWPRQRTGSTSQFQVTPLATSRAGGLILTGSF